MKKLTDEEIQKLLEHKTDPDEGLINLDEDIKIYQMVFEELAKEPAFSLPADFAAAVTDKAFEPQKAYNFNRLTVVLFASISLGLIFSIIAMFYVNQHFSKELLAAVLHLKWPILFGFAILILIELGDKLLIRRKMHAWNT